MTDKAGLPSDKDAAEQGGFVVLPRRIALLAAVGMIVSVAGPALSLYLSDQQQERRIIELERRVEKAETRAEIDRTAISEIRVDVRVVRQLLESQTRRQ